MLFQTKKTKNDLLSPSILFILTIQDWQKTCFLANLDFFYGKTVKRLFELG